MLRRLAFLLVAAATTVASVFVFGHRASAAMRTPAPVAAVDAPTYLHVRAEYVDLSGNRDENYTTLTFSNRSLTRTVELGDVLALGPDGLDEVIASAPGLVGLAIPPLGSVDVLVDKTSFPGLAPKLEVGSRGLESVLVSFTGPKEALRVISSILLNQPSSLDNRVLTRIEAQPTVK